jgi:hypothetical protein
VGSNKGDRFLDGVKKDGSDVGLGTQGGNGTVWKVYNEKNGLVRLECVSCSGNDKYLDGSRSAGADQLGLAIKSNSGTLWKMNKSSNGNVTFECAEKDSGPKLLSLKTDIINPAPSVPASGPVVETPRPVAVAATPAPAAPTQLVAASVQKPTAATAVASAPPPAAPANTTLQMAGSATQFKMNKVGTDKYTFEIVGLSKGDRFLDGVKKDGSEVGLGSQGGNGTVWKVHNETNGLVRLECVSCTGNNKYLDGSRSGGADQLGLAIKSNTGTLWKMNKGANGTVTFECAEKDSGPKLLSMKGDSASPAPSAPSATASSATPTKDNSKSGSASTATSSSSSQKTTSKTDSTDKSKSTKSEEPSSGVLMGSVGSQFIIHDKGGDLFTIEVVGLNKSAKYVDGSKNDGTVGLGVAGNKGTTWKKETDKDGNVRFRCADCTGSKVYLDGQQSDGSWAVGLGIKGNTGTEWKMVPQPDGRYSLECVDKKSGPKLLSFLSDGKTVAPSVPYDPKPVPSANPPTTAKPADNKKPAIAAPTLPPIPGPADGSMKLSNGNLAAIDKRINDQLSKIPANSSQQLAKVNGTSTVISSGKKVDKNSVSWNDFVASVSKGLGKKNGAVQIEVDGPDGNKMLLRLVPNDSSILLAQQWNPEEKYVFKTSDPQFIKSLEFKSEINSLLKDLNSKNFLLYNSQYTPDPQYAINWNYNYALTGGKIDWSVDDTKTMLAYMTKLVTLGLDKPSNKWLNEPDPLLKNYQEQQFLSGNGSQLSEQRQIAYDPLYNISSSALDIVLGLTGAAVSTVGVVGLTPPVAGVGAAVTAGSIASAAKKAVDKFLTAKLEGKLLRRLLAQSHFLILGNGQTSLRAALIR